MLKELLGEEVQEREKGKECGRVLDLESESSKEIGQDVPGDVQRRKQKAKKDTTKWNKKVLTK